MNIDKEVKIVMKQPFLSGGSEERDFLYGIIDHATETSTVKCEDSFILMAMAYNAGMIQGKRLERNRKKQ